MIFYFSATGNSKYVATRIAEETNEKLVSIADCCKKHEYSYILKEGEALGIVSPTYHWGLPSIVDSLLSNLQVNSANRPFVYFVATYGTTTGQSDAFVKRHLERIGFALSASHCVKMPDTWTPTFDLTDHLKVSRINQNAEPQIDKIIEQIKNTEHGNFMKARIPMIAVKIYRPTYEKDRKTQHFTVEESCIGCGLCARKCPVDAIEIQSSRPVWVKDKCVMCLGCLHRCPKFSIQYGTKTKNHSQYQNPHIKV